jgi:hypothetical protein
MNKRVAILLGLLAASRLFAGDLAETYAPLGRLIITNFASAPFPHPLRAEGHSYHDHFFSAAHYQDSRVALFVPKDFRPGNDIDFVVHFHGWGNNISNALAKYQLPEQFAASRRNAILLVPQGPLNASDSFGGKLEDAGGFKRFMAEALEVLRQQGIITKGRVGRVILSGHSGGYEVISAILACGGLTGKISEVWLFDALYAKTERFSLWFDHHPGRFIDLYTEHGGTKEESEALMTALRGNGVPYFSADETNTAPADLRNHRLLFLFSELPHDEVMQKRDTFRHFLETSVLEPTGPKSIRRVEAPNTPEDQALAERARRIGDEVYPQILQLLGDGQSKLPRRLDIVLREHLPSLSAGGDEMWGCACRQTAWLNAGWMRDHPEDLDSVLVHEMAHVAQNYPDMPYRHAWQWYAHYFGFKAAHPFRSYPLDMPSYWTEGIADYVCIKLGHTNAWQCPQCDEHYPEYKTGYTCAAAFLLYLDTTCGSDITRQLNAALRRGAYSDQFFPQTTGKTLDELWADFQMTRAYTPLAADFNELRQALGYAKGQPPKDLQPRLDKYLSQHPDIKDYFAKLDLWHGPPPENVQRYIESFLYVRRQPGSKEALQAAEAAIVDLHQALGFKDGRPPPDYQARLRTYLEAHPEMKESAAVHGWLDDHPSPLIEKSIEGFLLLRLQPGGRTSEAAEEFLAKLKREGKLPGWGKSEHGMLSIKTEGGDAEQSPVYRTFECRKTGGGDIYVFTVEQASPDSDWELTRAWKTTAKGRFLREFPVAIAPPLP